MSDPLFALAKSRSIPKQTSITGSEPGDTAHLLSIAFDTADYDAADTYDALNLFSAGLYRYAPAKSQAPVRSAPFRFALRAWSVQNLSAAHFTNNRVHTTTDGAEASKDPSTLFIRLQERGHVLAHSGGSSVTLKPGFIHIMHPDNSLDLRDDGEVMAVRVPYEHLGLDPSELPRFVSYATDAGMGLVVASAIRSFFETIDTVSVKEAQATSNALVDLFKGLIDHTEPSEATRYAVEKTRGPSMRQYIRKNLTNPDLSASALQSVFGASRATIYREFECDGGVARYIMEERLKAAYRDLESVVEKRGLVRDIASLYCFANTSGLSKAFRRFHGYSPTEVIGSNLALSEVTERPEGRAKPNLKGARLAEFWNIQSGVN